ncbi:hypothetical protein CL634_11145 [bacterium]|nr:hypothetical protein [bacterium]
MPGKQDNSKRPKKSPKKRVKKNELPQVQTRLLKDLLTEANHPESIRGAFEIMQEQMGSYVLMGYTFDGQPVTAVVANTPQEYDALFTRVAGFLQSKPPGAMMMSPPQEPE